MKNILTKAIFSAQLSDISFAKFITANDTGATGGHQAGFHIHKNSWELFFDKPGEKGKNQDKYVTIKWQDDFETISRFIYYGTGTRNEYRLTRFGRGFPFLDDTNIGDLLVISRKSNDYYEAFVLQTDENIEEFFASLNISSNNTNGIIPRQLQTNPNENIFKCFTDYISILKSDFPTTIELSNISRNCYKKAYKINDNIIKDNPDKEILCWLDAEFQLYKLLENDRYTNKILKPFDTVEELIQTANTILNRRKSRAGKSLEHHLSEMFKVFNLCFETQVMTEDKKRPDFIFPNIESYFNNKYNIDKLVVLAAKTTCKDRWRQILNEADKIRIKHLFTLQQGISKNQLEEMYKYNVCLVVPKPYITSFPIEFRDRILTLDKFIKHIQYLQQ